MCETIWLDQPTAAETIRVHHAGRTIITSGDDWLDQFMAERPNASWADFRHFFLDYYCNPGELQYEYDTLNQQQLRTAGGASYEEQFDAYVRRLNASSQDTAARRLLLSHWLEPHYNWRSAMRLYLLDNLPFHQYVGKARTAMPPAPPPRCNAARFGQRNGNNSNNSRSGPRNSDNPGRGSFNTGEANNGSNGPRRNNPSLDVDDFKKFVRDHEHDKDACTVTMGREEGDYKFVEFSRERIVKVIVWSGLGLDGF